MISIGIRIYQTRCPSLQIVEASKELMSEGAKESKTQVTVNVETLHTPSLGFQYVLDFCTLQEVIIWRNKKLKTLFSISACKSLPQLSRLNIYDCQELVNVVEDDCNDHHHMNYDSFFPKLEDLSIYDCNKLEFIFPLSLFGTLQKLKSLEINGAAELKYIFGKCHNEIESDKLHIRLPALEELEFVGVPKMINNIRTKKCQLSSPPLQSISLSDLQEFNGKSFPELMADLQLSATSPKKLTKLELSDSKIEEVLNLEGVEIEGPVMTLSLKEMVLRNLSELRHIWKGPKYMLSLINLEVLNITSCKKLRAIFNISIVKSLPQLFGLELEDCDELVDIIEESEGDHLHEPYFSKLNIIDIKRCNSLKFLFSISTRGMFPNLKDLIIEENSELERVFIHKQDDMRKMAKMKEVFPMLLNVRLRKLPRLITICEGIDFHTPKCCKVEDCPKYKEIGQIQEGFECGDSENEAARSDSPDFVERSNEAMKPSVEEVGSSSMSKDETVKEIEAKDPTRAPETQALKGSTAKPQLTSTSLHSYKDTKNEVGRAVLDPASKLPTTSSTFQESEDKHKTRDSIMQLQQEGLGETKPTKASHTTNIPFDDSSMDSKLNERAEEGSTLEDVVAATMVAVDLAPPSNSPNVTSSFVSQVEGSQSSSSSLIHRETEKEVGNVIPAAKSSEGIEKKGDRRHASQSSKSPTWTNLESTKDTMQQGLEENYTEDDALIAVGSTNSDSMKQSTRPIDNLCGTDFALSGKEKAKGIDEDATATTYTSPMSASSKRALTTEEIGAHSRIQEEAESEKPIKAVIPQVIPSVHQQSQIVEAVTSSPKLGICEIFKHVELKHGEAALLAKALERYPQLLLPLEHRTDHIIGLSYRVLVDILVMLANQTPSTITPSEKSILKTNLSEAIFFGFDKDWVESVHAKVFEVDQSNVSTAEEEIQAIEVELGDIDSQREKLIEKMTMFKDIISAKDKPFGI